jgi:opacity protein-like surface antigen
VIARITVLGFTLMAMIGAPVLAQAEAPPEYDFGRPGIYAGAGVAVGFENFDSPYFAEDYAGFDDYDTPVGFDFWAGYRLIPNLALEVELGYLGGFDLKRTHLKMDALTLTGNVKAYALTGRFQPFALAGVGMLNWRSEDSSAPSYNESVSSETDLAARFGAGIDVYLTEGFALEVKASYVLSTRDLDGSDYIDLIIGGQIRF